MVMNSHIQKYLLYFSEAIQDILLDLFKKQDKQVTKEILHD